MNADPTRTLAKKSAAYVKEPQVAERGVTSDPEPEFFVFDAVELEPTTCGQSLVKIDLGRGASNDSEAKC